jgi:hypothetical protein
MYEGIANGTGWPKMASEASDLAGECKFNYYVRLSYLDKFSRAVRRICIRYEQMKERSCVSKAGGIQRCTSSCRAAVRKLAPAVALHLPARATSTGHPPPPPPATANASSGPAPPPPRSALPGPPPSSSTGASSPALMRRHTASPARPRQRGARIRPPAPLLTRRPTEPRGGGAGAAQRRQRGRPLLPLLLPAAVRGPTAILERNVIRSAVRCRDHGEAGRGCSIRWRRPPVAREQIDSATTALAELRVRLRRLLRWDLRGDWSAEEHGRNGMRRSCRRGEGAGRRKGGDTDAEP